MELSNDTAAVPSDSQARLAVDKPALFHKSDPTYGSGSLITENRTFHFTMIGWQLLRRRHRSALVTRYHTFVLSEGIVVVHAVFESVCNIQGTAGRN